MIGCVLFEFTREGGRGCITEWLKKDQRSRAALNRRARDLENYGVGSEETRKYCAHIRDGIYKLKVTNRPQLRPHLCKGPENMNGEATFLAVAIEENDKLDPIDVVEIAGRNRTTLLQDPTRKAKLWTNAEKNS